MRSSLTEFFDRFIILIKFNALLLKIVWIGSIRIKPISIRKNYWISFSFLMRILILLCEMRSICCAWIERLFILTVYHILNKDWFSRHTFWSKTVFVFRRSVKWDFSILFFDSWHNYLTHCRLMARIVISIWRVYITKRYIITSFYFMVLTTIRRRFFPCVNWMPNILKLIAWDFV